MWNQIYNPLGNSALSTIAAAIPVVTLLVLIASGKVKAHLAAIIALVVALSAGLIGGYVGKSFAHGPMGGGFGGPMAMTGDIDPARIDAQIERMTKHLASEVNASAEQRDKIAAIGKAAAKDLLPLRTRLQDARKQAAALASAPTVDRAALEKLRAEQMALMDTVSKRVTQAMADAGDVLTPAQRQKIAERMKGGRSGHGGHGFWGRG